MNGRQAKKMRAMAGYNVNERDEEGNLSTRYMVTPKSQRKKFYAVGFNEDGTEKQASYTTATFMMKDCPRKMAKLLSTRISRIQRKQLFNGPGKAKKGGFKSRKGGVTPVVGVLRTVKPLRSEVTAYNWMLHGLGLSFAAV